MVIFSIFNISADEKDSIKLTIEGSNIYLEKEVEDLILDTLRLKGFITSEEVTTSIYIFVRDYFSNLKNRNVLDSYNMLTKRYQGSIGGLNNYTQRGKSISRVEIESIFIDSVGINNASSYVVLLVENSTRDIFNIDFYVGLKYDISTGWLIDSISNRS